MHQLSKDICIIYRNYDNIDHLENILKLKKYCKNIKTKFYLSNDIKLSIKLRLDGVYIPSFNNKINYVQNYSLPKNFDIVGSAHNITEINLKLKQKCSEIFLSPVFKVNKSKKFLGINRFNFMTLNKKAYFIALGGISEKNYKNIGDKLYKMADIIKINNPQDMYLSLVSFWNNTEQIVLNSSEPMSTPRDYDNWVENLDDRENMMFLDTISYLPDDILTKVDRSSMAVSLESRTPFLNHSLVELSQRIPIELKIKDGKGKWILRNILNDFIPANFIDKPKTGFGIPIAEWLRGPLKEWAEALIDSSRLKHDGYFNAELVTNMWDKHLNKSRNYGHHLWSILMFQAWLEKK